MVNRRLHHKASRVSGRAPVQRRPFVTQGLKSAKLLAQGCRQDCALTPRLGQRLKCRDGRTNSAAFAMLVIMQSVAPTAPTGLKEASRGGHNDVVLLLAIRCLGLHVTARDPCPEGFS